jgi:hypothetical protein
MEAHLASNFRFLKINNGAEGSDGAEMGGQSPTEIGIFKQKWQTNLLVNAIDSINIPYKEFIGY